MPMKHTIDLTASYGMSRLDLIFLLDLFYRQHLPFFCQYPKRLQYLGLFFHRHIPAISAVMIPGNCFYATFLVFFR